MSTSRSCAPAPSRVKALLVLAGDLPYPPTNGYRIRLYHLLKTLNDLGYDLHLLALAREKEFAAHKAELLSFCSTVEPVPYHINSLSGPADYFGRLVNLASRLPYGVARYKSRYMNERAGEWLRSKTIDAVLCEEPFLTVNLPLSLPVPLIMDSHNVEHVLIARYVALESNIARRAYAAIEAKRLLRFETLCWERSELILTCSEHDRRTIASVTPRTPLRVVPNVVDVSSYPLLPSAERLTVLYTGGMDWYPNRDAVQFFVSAVLPKLRVLVPGVKLVVAGREPSSGFRSRFAGMPDIEFAGSVGDMRAEIGKATACVVPLRIGSGTRLKILEAAAMAKAIVSTSIGAEGLEFAHGKEILLADSPDDFANAAADVLKHRDLRDSLGMAARRRVETQYSLSALHAALSSTFNIFGGHREYTPIHEADQVET